MPPLFHHLRNVVITIFSLRNMLLQALACIITYFIVISGFDWVYFITVHGSRFSAFVSPAIGIGMLVPIFGISLLYIIAKVKKDARLLVVTWALVQSAMLGWLVSSFYKAFTGRVQPPRQISDIFVDMSRNWNFGFFEHGIFWGWPSSHTTVAFAMSFAIISLFLKRKKIVWLAFFYALYIGIGISMQIHWFSEFIAGAIIGAIIGTAVGTNFQTKLSHTKESN